MLKQPLASWRVLVPRPEESSAFAVETLRLAGATPVCVPLIRFRPPTDGGAALAAAAARVEGYDWVIATSAQGAERLLAAVRDPTRLRSVAAIGPATAARFAAVGKEVDLLPECYLAEGLLTELGGVNPGRALLARAAEAREVLPAGLSAAGWKVDVVEAYRTEPLRLSEAERSAALSCDALLFTSPSVVNSYCEQLPPPKGLVTCIGPITASAAQRRGLRVDVEAAEYTVPGLITALHRRLERQT